MEVPLEIEYHLVGAAVMVIAVLFADSGFLDVFERGAVAIAVIVRIRAQDGIKDMLFEKVNQLLFIRHAIEIANHRPSARRGAAR